MKKEENPQYNIPCSCGSHNSFWKTVIESKYWESWYEEQMTRFKAGDYENCFDIDECMSCGWISPRHFEAFMSFIKKNYQLNKNI